MILFFLIQFSSSGADYHLEQILGRPAESPLVLVASLLHGLIEVGEEGPHGFVAVLDVAAQGERSVQEQEALGQAGVFKNGRLAGWNRKGGAKVKTSTSNHHPTH